MQTAKVIEWVDIDVPCSEVYDLVTNLTLRLQLSPLWGVTRVKEVSEDFPSVGSHYRAELVSGDQPAYETVIAENVPGRKLAYHLRNHLETKVTWLIGQTNRGARLTYQEEYLVPEEGGDEFAKSVRKAVQDWLKNIKRYMELRGSKKKRLAKWLVDRYYLKLRPDQRRTVQLVLFMQVLGMISFIMAAVALGVARAFTGL